MVNNLLSQDCKALLTESVLIQLSTVEVQKEAFELNADLKSAEKDEVEEAEIAMMDNVYKTESETSDEEGKNFNSAFCQISFIPEVDMIKYVEMCYAEKDEESDEEGIARTYPVTDGM